MPVQALGLQGYHTVQAGEFTSHVADHHASFQTELVVKDILIVLLDWYTQCRPMRKLCPHSAVE